MFNGESLSLWPESTGGRSEEKPIKDDSFKPEDDGAEIKEEEKKSQENYRPDAIGILARLREAPSTDQEEIKRRQAEYFKKVYPDHPSPTRPNVAPEDIRKIRENLKDAVGRKLQPQKLSDYSINPSDGREQDDPWHDINPPAMFQNRRIKNRK
jgi:hypothetical protein